MTNYLASKDKPVLFYDVSCVADSAAREAGKKKELFNSLWDYDAVLPGGWNVRWLSASDSPTADSMAFVVPSGWRSGNDQSDQLLLGGGILREANNLMLQ